MINLAQQQRDKETLERLCFVSRSDEAMKMKFELGRTLTIEELECLYDRKGREAKRHAF